MLPLSNLSIQINKSIDLLRCIIVVHLAAAALVMQANFPLPISILMLVLLALSLQRAYQDPSPKPHFIKLTCHPQFWQLHTIDGRQIQYDSLRINFDGGFFLMLLLTNKTTKKRLVVFNDQIDASAHRLLTVLSRAK